MTLASDPYVWGTGRRKTSVARVRIKQGSGQFIVNGRPIDEFFTTDATKNRVMQALDVTESRESYDVWCRVDGGGITGQSGAVALGLSRALKTDNANLEPTLREFQLLTRDSRKVERKKYGLRKARRATQFSKR